MSQAGYAQARISGWVCRASWWGLVRARGARLLLPGCICCAVSILPRYSRAIVRVAVDCCSAQEGSGEGNIVVERLLKEDRVQHENPAGPKFLNRTDRPNLKKEPTSDQTRRHNHPREGRISRRTIFTGTEEEMNSAVRPPRKQTERGL